MRYLGLDLGSKTLGIAVSDLTGIVASSLTILKYENNNYEKLIEGLKQVIKDREFKAFVLGYPKNMNNTIGVRCEKVLEFKKILETTFNIEVVLEDERLTSIIANNILIAADLSRRKRKQVVDKMAATIILQNYLDRKKGSL